MSNPQKCLQKCFGYEAIIFSAVFISLLPVLLRAPLPHPTPRFHAEPYGLLLVAMRELMLLMPAVVAVVSGLAWWALRKRGQSTWQWGIAASISSLVLSIPFLTADVVIVEYSLAGVVGFTGVLVLFMALFSIGVAGVAAFGKRNALFAADPAISHVTTNENRMGALASTL